MKMRFSSRRYAVFSLKNLVKIIFAYLVVLILYNEIFSFALSNLLWADVHCTTSNRTQCVRILLVADPQLLGDNDATKIERWDSDRYLYYTYNPLVAHFNPDVIVFLGDMLDEGSVATDVQYDEYVQRFNSIFFYNYIDMIYVPGDNDIGGEFADFITQHKVTRYKKKLSRDQGNVVKYRSISFYKINRLTGEFPPRSHVRINDSLRIGISHLPLLYAPSNFLDNVLNVIMPTLVFSAHVHKPLIINTVLQSAENRHTTPVAVNQNRLYPMIIRKDRVYEFVVPTCSYRMGVESMGYGGVVLDLERMRLTYTIFWLPSRLTHLRFYLYSGILIGIILCVYFFPFFWSTGVHAYIKHMRSYQRSLTSKA